MPRLWLPPHRPTGRPLGEALNPDGTLKTGPIGSFDARQFRMGTAPDGRPVFRPTGTTGAGDEFWLSGFGLPNGVDGVVYAVVRSGTDMYIGGSFTAVGNVIANGVAKWNGAVWSSLGTGPANGMIGPVYALAVASTGDVYAGGNFATAGGMTANNVARWTGTAWSPLTGAANGVSGSVYALALASTGYLFVGGAFTTAGGTMANGVAKWNGTVWSPLSSATATGVNGFAVYDPNMPLATVTYLPATLVALFPNPAHGTATLRLPASAPRQQPLILNDALGRPVRYYSSPASPDTELNLRGLPAGVYLVRCGMLIQRLVVE